ncbi:MAG TPA: M48 family metalloprotease [Actinomycetota bacterium]|nr:M48 family metalloprotease [Actinomycetota bacterium]
MYEQIAANRRRSALLIAFFIVLVAAVGWSVGQVTGLGVASLPVAVALSLVLTWSSYYNSDKLVIRLSKAIPVDQVQWPEGQAYLGPRLRNVVEGMAIAAGLPVPKTYVIYDPAPNAFATGRDPQHSAIAVTSGLLEKMDRVELEGVIGHEMSHIRNHDILVTTLAVVMAGVIALLSDWLLRGFWRMGGRRRSGGAVVGIAGLVLAILAPVIAMVIQMAVSRRREFLADASGVQLTRYPPGLISALRKLKADSTVVRTGSRATAHLWIESPLDRSGAGSSWLNRLFDTHPPLDERIRILESM